VTVDNNEKERRDLESLEQRYLRSAPNLNPVGEPEPSMTVDNNEKERQHLDSLEQRYLRSADPEEKIETIAQISDLPDAEAVPALGRLFRNEPSVELRCELLGAIIGCEENEPAKLEALTGALLPAQPPSVRQIAIAGLETMDTPEAKELLQRMRYDSDPDIRAAVAEALETEP
jgi:hypothetical protein